MTAWLGRCRARATLVAVGLAIVTAAAAIQAPVATAQPESAGSDPHPLKEAAKAAERLSFVGVLLVRWTEANTSRQERLLVEGAHGSVVVKGGTVVMASADHRLVEHTGGEWDLLWPSSSALLGRPDLGLKYQLASQPGPLVSNRPTRAVEARRGGALVERMYLDADTGLLLRREQFENGQGPVRTVEFESLTLGAPPTASAPVFPSKVVDAAPKVVSAGSLPAGVSAPVALADGYRRVGLYERSNALQAVYSDGLYDLSIFEQRGRLDGDDVPEGRRIAVGAERGWHYAWAGGHVVLWQDGGTVFTAVSDAPLDQVVTAVRSLPPVTASVSLLHRLRQVCRALLQPLSA